MDLNNLVHVAKLLDIMMPELDGYGVLTHLKTDPILRHLPVVVISAIDDPNSVVRCIELGADDYMFKPFNKVLLKARVGACLEKKWLRDQEQNYLRAIQAEQEKSERLLLNNTSACKINMNLRSEAASRSRAKARSELIC